MVTRRYLIGLEHVKGSNYGAHVPDLLGCVATGRTREECMRNIREAIEFHLDGMLRRGLEIPPPSTTPADEEGDTEYVEVEVDSEVAA